MISMRETVRSGPRPVARILSLVANAGDDDRTLGLRRTPRFRTRDKAGQTGHAERVLGPKVGSCRHNSLWRTCQLRDRHPIRARVSRPSRKFGLLTPCFRFRLLLPVAMATGRLGVGETLGALNTALGPGDPVWFKETRARHLRARDFLAPRPALQARFGDGQVPERVIRAVAGLQGPGVAPVMRCAPTPAGLALQLQRPAVFERVLGAVPAYAVPAVPAAPGPRVLLHCPALRGAPGSLRLSRLRAVLVADHLARALRAHGVRVRLVPAVRDPHMPTFLQQLRVDWPAASESAATEALRSRALAELGPAREGGALAPGVLGTVSLKEVLQERGRAAGYDPKLDKCLVTEDQLSVLAELQEAVSQWPQASPPGLAAAPHASADVCMVVHVVSCEEEFQQQKLDLLWWKLDDQAPLTQKHLVCGPVKVTGTPSKLTAPEYYEFRHTQVCKASALKHGRDLVQDPAWTEIFSILSAATIKFEMLSTAPQSQLLLALADSSISTKGTRSGTFVMYNCARLATLFEGYKHSTEQGLYPTFPPVSSLDFSLLQDETCWARQQPWHVQPQGST
ncbi:DALR anticodon-binding domain-containing protein 3 isoform X2 [Vulpes vulpes]|uniref:DALR anticodon-binding domain-containing protein 3 isoform X2 n=1 Tax=Vulpes vulpes TaxID=9627 RepID=A0ABM4XK74_VULVU|nr:DALR anticodon-binding domain-containing protein 3 isoform X2 [Vulpes vulpes]